MELVKAVPDDHIKIGAVKTLLQWTGNTYESTKANMGAIAPANASVREAVRKEQNRDEDLKAIIDFKLTGRLPQDPVIAQSVQTQKNDFMVCNGVLHRDDPKNESQGLRSLPIVVPEHLRKEVLEENHGLVTSGHFAVSKVWRRMRPLY